MHSPLTIQNVFANKAKVFLPQMELFEIKQSVFSNLAKSKLEDVIKTTKQILEKYKMQLNQRMKNSGDLSDCESKQSSHTKDSKGERMKYAEIYDQQEKIFLLTLLTFHSDNILTAETVLEKQQAIKILVGQSNFKPAEFFFAIEEENQDDKYTSFFI